MSVSLSDQAYLNLLLIQFHCSVGETTEICDFPVGKCFLSSLLSSTAAQSLIALEIAVS